MCKNRAVFCAGSYPVSAPPHPSKSHCCCCRPRTAQKGPGHPQHRDSFSDVITDTLKSNPIPVLCSRKLFHSPRVGNKQRFWTFLWSIISSHKISSVFISNYNLTSSHTKPSMVPKWPNPRNRHWSSTRRSSCWLESKKPNLAASERKETERKKKKLKALCS
jgi:hypothetical protein